MAASQQFCVRWNSHLGSLGAAFPQVSYFYKYISMHLLFDHFYVIYFFYTCFFVYIIYYRIIKLKCCDNNLKHIMKSPRCENCNSL